MTRKLKLFTAVLFAAAFVVIFSVTSYADEVRCGVVVTESSTQVNIRSTPSVYGRWVMSISRGCKIILHEQVGNWYKVSYNGTTGYMCADYVVPQCSDETASYGYAVVTGSFVYMRSAPTTDAMSVATLSEGVNVRVTGIREGWYKVKFGDFTGYMSADYLSPIKVDTSVTITARQKTAGEKIVEIAKKYLGIKYVWGGSTPTQGFDCSGLTQWVYKEYGITLRVRTQQYLDGKSVTYANLQPGDLVFFDTYRNGTVGHVGIYVGNGSFIHAPTYGKPVQITNMTSGFYRNTFVCARRFV